jgi:hypothetical protein
MRRKAWILITLLGLAACGDDDGQGPDAAVACPVPPPADPATAPLRGACLLEDRYGGFIVTEAGGTTVSGEVADGVVPLTLLQPVAAEGDCELLRRPNPFCSPPCDNGFTCGLQGTCVPFPLRQDLGTVHVEGLEVCLDLVPTALGHLYSASDVRFTPGALLRLTSGAGAYGPLELWGLGPTPLETDDATWTITAGQPLPVTWTPGVAAERSRVFLHLNVDQHGASPVTLFCDVEDSGSTSIPASLIDGLLATTSGFPSAGIHRRTVDSQTVGGGCVDLVVKSSKVIDLRVGP